MSESIYAPPEADLTAPANGTPRYYVVAPIKFALLSVLTFTLYFVYWFYRNWRLVKDRDQDNSWPPMRGFFYVFFTHALFTDVNESIKTSGRTYDWQPMSVATLFVVLAIATNIIDRMAGRGIGSPDTDAIGMVLTLFLPAALLPAQRAINFACNDPAGTTNSRFSAANWAWMIVGGLFWLLILFGLYAMYFAPELLEG